MDITKNGLETTYPNPFVSSVIVYDDKIIGEGWYRKTGTPHAEVLAINSVKDKKPIFLGRYEAKNLRIAWLDNDFSKK